MLLWSQEEPGQAVWRQDYPRRSEAFLCLQPAVLLSTPDHAHAAPQTRSTGRSLGRPSAGTHQVFCASEGEATGNLGLERRHPPVPLQRIQQEKLFWDHRQLHTIGPRHLHPVAPGAHWQHVRHLWTLPVWNSVPSVAPTTSCLHHLCRHGSVPSMWHGPLQVLAPATNNQTTIARTARNTNFF